MGPQEDEMGCADEVAENGKNQCGNRRCANPKCI